MNKTPKFLVGAIAFIVLAICVLFGVATYHRLRAASFMQDFIALRIGTATFTQAQQVATKYRAKSSGTHVQDACSIQNCWLSFVFRNWLFNHLQKSREISLAGGLIIKDNRVTGRELDYSILATSPDDQFMYILFDRLQFENDKGYTIKQEKVDARGLAHYIEVDLGTNAPDEIRKRAYSIDLSCLSRFVGCGSSRDILPADWPIVK